MVAYKPQGFRLHTPIISCSDDSNKFYSRPSDSGDIYVQEYGGKDLMKTIW